MDQGESSPSNRLYALELRPALPLQGGDDVWGNATSAPDDLSNSTHSHGALIAFREASSALDGDMDLNNMTSNEAGTWILERTPTTFQVRMSIRKKLLF